MKKRVKFSRPFLFSALRIGLALGIAVILCQIQLDYIESFTYDLRVRLRPTPPVSGHVQTLIYDTRTQEILKRAPDALDYIKLFQKLAEAKPAAVLYVADFADIIGSYEELEALAEAVKPLNFYVAEQGRVPEKGLEEDFRLLPPLQDIRVESGPRTADRNSFAKDGVTRRVILSSDGQPLLHLKLASLFNGLTQDSQYRGTFEFKDSKQAFINFHPAGTYKPLSFVDVMNGDFDPAQVTGKLVIIGRDTHSEVTDYILTPYSRDNTAMSLVEMHANMMDTLILNSAPVRSPQWLNILTTSLIAIFTMFVVLSLRPLQGLIILGFTVVSYFAFCLLCFMVSGFWLDMAHPLLAIFIYYYFFIPYRLIVENRRSWEYYQRNKLLTQVEELKSNFLRLMSHDLKTPIARIQGMAEMALREPGQLSPQQMEALKNIATSSEELEHFVGSVLNLSRIESKEIKLQLKSRDINALLQDVIKKCEYQAKQKNIQIITEFEPMFSMKIDEDLMRQVFTNLIENAIKYSPKDTRILVSTRENDGNVTVQVADQGLGISKDEIGNLFTKFYRTSNVRDTDIKGSGLGLYLSRYFVELHKGQISVESEPNKGSTFSVELPMTLS